MSSSSSSSSNLNRPPPMSNQMAAQSSQALPKQGKNKWLGIKIKSLQVDPDDSTTEVAMMELKRSSGFFSGLKLKAKKWMIKLTGRYVVTKVDLDKGDESKVVKVALDMHSLAATLGLTTKEVRALRKKKQLGPLLKQVKKGVQADDAVHEYLGADAGEKLSVQSLAGIFTQNALQPMSTIQRGNKTLRLKGALITVGEEEKIGEGAFGTAYKLHGLAVDSFEISDFAQKRSNIDDSNKKFTKWTLKDLKKEAKNLKEITRMAIKEGWGDVLKGMQEAPIGVTYLGKKGKKQGVMTGRLYQGDLENLILKEDMSLEEGIEAVKPMLKFFAFMQEKGIVHTDIKPENIFVDEENGVRFFRLGDFGGARWKKDLTFGDTLVLDPKYSPLNEFGMLYQGDLKRFHRLGTFQMGVSLFKLFSGGDYPYNHSTVKMGNNDYVEFLDTSSSFNEKALKEKGCPQELIEFIGKMVAQNPEERPIGSEFLMAWEKLEGILAGLDLAQAAQVSQLQKEAKEREWLLTPVRGHIDFLVRTKEILKGESFELCKNQLESSSQAVFASMQNDQEEAIVIKTLHGEFIKVALDDSRILEGLKNNKNIIDILYEVKNEFELLFMADWMLGDNKTDLSIED